MKIMNDLSHRISAMVNIRAVDNMQAAEGRREPKFRKTVNI